MKKAPRQRGTIEKHGSPWKMDTIVVIASPTRGFVLPPPDMPPVTSPYPARPKIRMKKAHWVIQSPRYSRIASSRVAISPGLSNPRRLCSLGLSTVCRSVALT